jgi:hypothetical protein
LTLYREISYNKPYVRKKISKETTAKALVSQMDNGETDGT